MDSRFVIKDFKTFGILLDRMTTTRNRQGDFARKERLFRNAGFFKPIRPHYLINSIAVEILGCFKTNPVDICASFLEDVNRLISIEFFSFLVPPQFWGDK